MCELLKGLSKLHEKGALLYSISPGLAKDCQISRRLFELLIEFFLKVRQLLRKMVVEEIAETLAEGSDPQDVLVELAVGTSGEKGSLVLIALSERANHFFLGPGTLLEMH